MWREHLYLNWKKLWRSKRVGTSLIMRALTGFSMLYIGGMLLMLGIGFVHIVEDFDVDDAYALLTKYTLYYLLADLAIRTMALKVPFDRFESLILHPVTKRSIIQSVIGTSIVSGFNVLPLLFLVPAAITVIHPIGGLALMLGWLVSMVATLVIVHFVALRLKSLVNSRPWIYPVLIGLVGLLIYIDYAGLWEWTLMKHRVAWASPLPAVLAAVVLCGVAWLLYQWNVRVMHSQAYLAASFRSQSQTWYAGELQSLDRLGGAGDALREQLWLILRNKRLRTQMIFSLLIIPLGYVFFFTEHYEGPIFKLFWGFYLMGLVPMNLALYLWAHRADHIGLLYTMPLSMHTYVRRQYIAYLLLTLVTAVPSCIYLIMDIGLIRYFGTAWLYLAGILLPMLMLAAVFNRTPMEINTSGTFNYQGVSAMQIFVVLIALTLPCILFVAFSVWGYTDYGLAVLAGMGILGILCLPLWLRWIANWSSQEKYALYHGYRQQK